MKFSEIEAGLTITTADENIRKIFEPNSPRIRERIEALEKLHSTGLKTYAMIAPLLPGAEELVTLLSGKVDHVLIDKMNYHYADWVYKKYGLEYAITDRFFTEKKNELARAFEKKEMPYQLLF
jgi:DNA repair photolyase